MTGRDTTADAAAYRPGATFRITTSLGERSRHAGRIARIVSEETPGCYGSADVLGLSGRVIDHLTFRGRDLPL